MATFLESYVRRPIQDLLEKGSDELPELVASWSEDAILIKLGNEVLKVDREPTPTENGRDPIPEDAVDET